MAASRNVTIHWNGIKVARCKKYSYDLKKDNDIVKHFDGIDIAEDETEQWDLSFDRTVTYDPNFEKNLAANLKSNIPIVITGTRNGKQFTDTCTGGYMTKYSGDVSPGKLDSETIGFTVLKRVRKWS